jgi:hypothetical protein|tara:strand:- start:1239 stop:1874 length:636 start_codon:yes stop_codon:yes gene_type:complete
VKSTARIQKVIALNEARQLLTPWDERFLSSLLSQAPHRTLSVKQNDHLQKIESKLSPTALNAIKAWEQNWDTEKARTLRIVAEYYQETSYFTTLSRQVLSNPAYIPSKAVYEKMCENKYAKRVLEMAADAPVFPEGTTVMLRATAKKTLAITQFNKLKDCPLFVLRVLPHIRSSAKGAKLYEILSGGSCDVFRIEERFLKSYRPLSVRKPV